MRIVVTEIAVAIAQFFGILGPVYAEDISISGTASWTLESNIYYAYEPKADITPYELALMLPFFSGISYGAGEWSSQDGCIVPRKDRRQGGMPSNGTVMSFGSWQVERLGTAIRHFRKLDIAQ